MDALELFVDEEQRIVRVVVSGEIALDEGREVISRARRAAAEHGYPVLYDVRRASLRAGVMDWFKLPRELDVLQKSPTRFVRAALLIPQDDQVDGYRFYETVTGNLGLHVRAFFDEAEALSWLSPTER